MDAGGRTGWVVGYWVTFVRVKLVGRGGGVYMAFFPECKDSSEPSLASRKRKRRPNKNNMRTNQQGSSPNKIFAKLWEKVTNILTLPPSRMMTILNKT